MTIHKTGPFTSGISLTEKFASLDEWHNVRIEFMTLGQLRVAATECYQTGKIIRAQAAEQHTVTQLVHLYPDMLALGFQFNRKADQIQDNPEETDSARLEKLGLAYCEAAMARITGHCRSSNT